LTRSRKGRAVVDTEGVVGEFTTSIEIAATPARIWNVLSDLERWREWTPSIERITPLDDAPLGVGSKVRIEQPRLRPATWEITSWEPGRGFTWKSWGVGYSALGDHRINPGPSGCRVDLALRLDGVLGRLAGRLGRGLIERYIGFEAGGLKDRSEQPY
jgi:hypothetical protein